MNGIRFDAWAIPRGGETQGHRIHSASRLRGPDDEDYSRAATIKANKRHGAAVWTGAAEGHADRRAPETRWPNGRPFWADCGEPDSTSAPQSVGNPRLTTASEGRRATGILAHLRSALSGSLDDGPAFRQEFAMATVSQARATSSRPPGAPRQMERLGGPD